MELSVVMPCLNEAETVSICVAKAGQFLAEHGIDGEVIVADNGSSDGSQLLAEAAGAVVVDAFDRGYGNALMTGIRAARGRFVVMGDSDNSYDFSALLPFLAKLREGADLVMGNRFQGGIAPGAMPALHRYLGNPVLSFIGRLFFGSPVGDFHCGLRAFRRESILDLGLQSSGMEFATEMVVRATLEGLTVVEVPTTLYPDGRSHPPHLRTWRDGWRHFRFLLLYSPRWLFLNPGLVFVALGLLVGIPVTIAPLHIGSVTFDVGSLLGAAVCFIIGVQSVLFAVLTRIYATEEGFLPRSPMLTRVFKVVTLERGLLAGGTLGLFGITGFVLALLLWHGHHFGVLDPDRSLRLVVPSVTALVVSCQIILASLFASILGIRRIRTMPEHELPASTSFEAPRTDTSQGVR